MPLSDMERMLIFSRQLSDSEMANWNLVCVTLAAHYWLCDNVVELKANCTNYRWVCDFVESKHTLLINRLRRP